MAGKIDNYAIQMAQAKKLFLTYDQQELIRRCALRYDDDYFYITFLTEPYRIHRHRGDMERFCGDMWMDANSFGEVMTILDWLCDSRTDRYITGNWVNLVNQGAYFHRNLQEGPDRNAEFFDSNLQAFKDACLALKGEPHPGADVGYAIELVDGLKILVQLWRGDEEFPAHLRFLWDENTTRYIRYETSWYALGILLSRIQEKMKKGETR